MWINGIPDEVILAVIIALLGFPTIILTYFLNSRQTREFSLIEELWRRKLDSYTQIDLLNKEMIDACITYNGLQAVIDSDEHANWKIIQFEFTLRLLESYDLDIDNNALMDQVKQKIGEKKVMITKEVIDGVLSFVMPNIHNGFVRWYSRRSLDLMKEIHKADFITDDHEIISIAYDILDNHKSIFKEYSNGVKEKNPELDKNDMELRNSFKARARSELKRTKRGKTLAPDSTHSSNNSKLDNEKNSDFLAIRLAFVQTWIGTFLTFYVIGLTVSGLNLMFWSLVSFFAGLLLTALIFSGYSSIDNEMTFTKVTGKMLNHIGSVIIISILAIVILLPFALIFN